MLKRRAANAAAAPSFVVGGERIACEPPAAGLHLVATPIGNLADITVRALSVLAAADRVLCEDTRITTRLLQRYGIRTPLGVYHEHNAARARPRILRDLAGGACLALVSDAGTPLVSDPGYKLVRAVLDAGIAVHMAPGPSAVPMALVLSGLPSDRFLFAGFVPPAIGRRRAFLSGLADIDATLVMFETAHRLGATLADIAALLGDRQVAVARELTKLHEEVLRGQVSQIVAALAARAPLRGEITLVVAPPPQGGAATDDEVAEALAAALERLPAGRAAAEVARRYGLPRGDLYRRALALKGAGDVDGEP